MRARNRQMRGAPTKLSDWSPMQFTGLTGWFRADRVTGSGASTSVTDLSGNARHLTVPGGGVVPTITTSGSFNNQSVFTFNGSSQCLVGPAMSNFLSATDGTILVVVSPTLALAGMIVAADYVTNNRVSLENAGSSSARAVNYDGTIDVTAGVTFNNSTVYKTEWSHTGGTLTVRANAGTASIASGNTTTPLAALTRVCGHPGNGGFLNCTIAEIVFLNQAMTAGDRTSWNAYVLARYGI